MHQHVEGARSFDNQTNEPCRACDSPTNQVDVGVSGRTYSPKNTFRSHQTAALLLYFISLITPHTHTMGFSVALTHHQLTRLNHRSNST